RCSSSSSPVARSPTSPTTSYSPSARSRSKTSKRAGTTRLRDSSSTVSGFATVRPKVRRPQRPILSNVMNAKGAPPEAPVEDGFDEEQQVESTPEAEASDDDSGIGARVTAVFTAAEKAGHDIVSPARGGADR